MATRRRNSFCCKPPACVATRWGCAATGVWYPGWSQYFLNDAPMSRRPWLHRIQCAASAVLCAACRVVRGAAAWQRMGCAHSGPPAGGSKPAGAAGAVGRVGLRHRQRWWGGRCRMRPCRAVQCGWYGEAGDCATPHAACCVGTRRSMRFSSSTPSTRASPTAATPRRGVPSLSLSPSGPIRPDSH